MSTTGGKRVRVRVRHQPAPLYLPPRQDCRKLALLATLRRRVRRRRADLSEGEVSREDMEGRQLIRVRRRKRRSKKRYVLIGMLLFLCLAGSVSSLVGYLVYNAY